MIALAIRLDHLIKSGQVTDQAELARVGHVSPARLTQIMDLNLLAPEIQEVPFVPGTYCRAPIAGPGTYRRARQSLTRLPGHRDGDET